MSVSISFAWWVLPTVISVVALLWALFWPVHEDRMFVGLSRLFMAVPALFVIAVAWAIAGVLK